MKKILRWSASKQTVQVHPFESLPVYHQMTARRAAYHIHLHMESSGANMSPMLNYSKPLGGLIDPDPTFARYAQKYKDTFKYQLDLFKAAFPDRNWNMTEAPGNPARHEMCK